MYLIVFSLLKIFYHIFFFQEGFRNIPQNLRKCRFPDESNLKIFSHYTESNCELECAWNQAEEVCGCRPWFVPALDSSQTCFVLGNVCFDQTMEKIEKGEIATSCNCDEDCTKNLYSVTQKDDVLLERSAPKIYSYDWYGINANPAYGTFGTNILDGFDYDKTYWSNMGKSYRECLNFT